MGVNPEVSRQMIEDLDVLAGNDHYSVWHMCPDSCERHHFDPTLVAEQLRLAMDETAGLKAEVAKLVDLYHASRANNLQATDMLAEKDAEIADLKSQLDDSRAECVRVRSDYDRCARYMRDLGVDPFEGLP